MTHTNSSVQLLMLPIVVCVAFMSNTHNNRQQLQLHAAVVCVVLAHEGGVSPWHAMTYVVCICAVGFCIRVVAGIPSRAVSSHLHGTCNEVWPCEGV